MGAIVVRFRAITPSLVVVFFGMVIVAGGCSPEVVPSSGPRSPTNPASVEIYPKEPKKYEKLGVVEVPVGGDVRWDEKGEATAGFERLKAGAAAVGANGILLNPPPAPGMASVLAGYKGTFYQVPVRPGNPKAVAVQAIYVIDR
jgi:hypothetical protein